MRDEDDKLTFFFNGDPQVAIFRLMAVNIEEQEHNLVKFYNEFLIDIYMLLDKVKSRHVALDWDNTISADPVYFLQLIKKLQQAGYSPFVCTLRAPNKDNINKIRDVLGKTHIPIYLTDSEPKRKYLNKMGIKVHLWIDDFYPGICGDSCKLLVKNNIQ